MFQKKALMGAIAVSVFTFGPVRADETAQNMVDEALPHMHHTCASLIEEADGDDDYVLVVVGKITALSLYNREIDVAQIAASDAEKEQLRETFLAEVSSGCGADQNALLAGVIDDAVKTTLGL
ncbi:MAG: hypothetical protein ABJI96_03740 [Paracoccaceae bacterium]